MNTSHPTQQFYEAFTGEEAALIELTLDALGTAYTRIDNHMDAAQKSIRFYVADKSHYFEDMKVNIVDRCLKNKDLNPKFESLLTVIKKYCCEEWRVWRAIDAVIRTGVENV